MKFKISILTGVVLLFFVVGFQSNCDKKGVTNSTSKVKVTPVDSSLFIKENLLEPIATEDCELSDGTKTKCYKITVKGIPGEHKMGPWCPERSTTARKKAESGSKTERFMMLTASLLLIWMNFIPIRNGNFTAKTARSK